MADVLTVVGRRGTDEANADAVACLEVWLERVRSGEITSVAVAGVGPGRAEYGHSSFVDAQLIGSVGVLHQKLIANLLE